MAEDMNQLHEIEVLWGNKILLLLSDKTVGIKISQAPRLNLLKIQKD